MLHLFYGGTFDPVHNGHLALARAARDQLDAQVALIPAADPPHRAPPGASAEQRAQMLEQAIAGEPCLYVDRRELHRATHLPPRHSYTVDTLRELRTELGSHVSLAWLMGADSLLGLPTWHQWQALFELTHFVVAERPGNALDGALPAALATATAGRWTREPSQLRRLPAGRIYRLPLPSHPESASAVRTRIASGQTWQSWVPPAVAAYILQHRLYITPTSRDAPV